MPTSVYPLLNMHFEVEFNNKDFVTDKSFQSVNGIKARICENVDKRGTYIQFENIILKRAYSPNSKLVEWCMNAINNQKIQPVDLTINLLNAKHELLAGWRVVKAIPVAWGVDVLHAQETKILIETIELKYLHFHVLNSKGKVVAPTQKLLNK